MRYIHTRCGGVVNYKKRQCTKCRKKWNFFSFWFNPNDIRAQAEPKVKVTSKRRPITASPRWTDTIPGADWFVNLLPKWPRWARILSTIVFVAIVVVIVYLIRR